jgi:hypothetical protein
MKRQWRIHRQVVEVVDGQRRWDRAYQCLLRWGSPVWPEQPAEAVTGLQPMQEVSDESRRVCASVDPTPGTGPDD